MLKISLTIIALLSCGELAFNRERLQGENLLENGSFDEWTNSKADSWHSRTLFVPPRKVPTFDQQGIKIDSSRYGVNYISQTVRTNRGQFYHFEVDLLYYYGITNNIGATIISDDKVIGYHFLENYVYNERKHLSIRFKAGGNQAEVRLGFRKMGKAEAIFDNARLHQVDTPREVLSGVFAGIVSNELGLDQFDSSGYHRNVLSITTYVNSILISPLRNYYDNFPGDSVAREAYLLESTELRRQHSQLLMGYIPKSYFAEYSALGIEETSEFYCQKISMSSNDVLDEFNIPARQIHMSDEAGVSFHQLFEYWNPYLSKWILVDGFYGTTFTNAEGELIGLDKLLQLLQGGYALEHLVRNEGLESFYFNFQEMQKGWEAHQIQVRYHKHRRMTYAY